MSPRALGVGLFLFLCLAAPMGAAGGGASALVEEARRFHGDGAFDPAADGYLRALAIEETPEARLGLARVFRDAERWKLAAFSYRRYLEAVPGDDMASTEGAGVFVKAGFLAEAIAVYRRLRPKYPDLAKDGRIQVLVALGDRAMEAGRWASARKAFQRANRLSGYAAWTVNRLVKALLKMDGILTAKGAHRELLDVLLELYVQMPDPVLGDRIRETFLRAGAPAELRRRVEACEED